ncbi:MAG: hypothetical protein M0T77_10245 [Actinomycetota bacterium]|nr:hypothetical protein [Actinomycetota bacterium]
MRGGAQRPRHFAAPAPRDDGKASGCQAHRAFGAGGERWPGRALLEALYAREVDAVCAAVLTLTVDAGSPGERLKV